MTTSLSSRARRPVATPSRREEVAVVVAASCSRGGAVARAATAELGPARVLPSDSPELAATASTGCRVYVLDPGRLHAWRNRRRAGDAAAALSAPMTAAERLTLLAALREHAGAVRWVTSQRALAAVGR